MIKQFADGLTTFAIGVARAILLIAFIPTTAVMIVALIDHDVQLPAKQYWMPIWFGILIAIAHLRTK